MLSTHMVSYKYLVLSQARSSPICLKLKAVAPLLKVLLKTQGRFCSLENMFIFVIVKIQIQFTHIITNYPYNK